MAKPRDVYEKMTRKAAKRLEADTVDDTRWWSAAASLIEAEMASTGFDADRAQAVVASRLRKSGTQILGLLDYPPVAVHGMDLARQLEARGVQIEEQEAAFNALEVAGKISEIHDWWVRVREPVPLSLDDVEWMTGSGRFAQ